MRRSLLNRKRVIVGLLGCLMVALLGIGVASHALARVVVTVRLETSASVSATGVQLSVFGDRATLPDLRVGDERSCVLKPDGDSDVELRYELDGKPCRWKGGYVERTGGYRVLLVIHGCGDVRESTHLWPHSGP